MFCGKISGNSSQGEENRVDLKEILQYYICISNCSGVYFTLGNPRRVPSITPALLKHSFNIQPRFHLALALCIVTVSSAGDGGTAGASSYVRVRCRRRFRTQALSFAAGKLQH